MTSFEIYARRELPQLVRCSLENVNEDTQELTESVKSQIVSMIQDCQDRLFEKYKANMGYRQ
jgi:hypothetical protein